MDPLRFSLVIRLSMWSSIVFFYTLERKFPQKCRILALCGLTVGTPSEILESSIDCSFQFQRAIKLFETLYWLYFACPLGSWTTINAQFPIFSRHTYCESAENWELSIDHSLKSQRTRKVQSIRYFKLKWGTYVHWWRPRIPHSVGNCA